MGDRREDGLGGTLGSDCTVNMTDRDIASASGDFYWGNRLVLLW